jgi:uncharacterized protein (TIGR01777 family)
VRREPENSSESRWDPAAAEILPGSSRSALEGLAAAIHLSGANVAAHRWTPAYRREMWASRVESTRRLCELLAGLRQKPEVLLAASAMGIYGDRGEELLDENSKAGSGFLADLCRAWEEASAPAEQAGIRVVHLRFGVVLGGGGALAKMLPVFRMGLGGRIGNGCQWMSWVALADAVAAVRFLLREQRISGAVNVTAPNPVTNAEFTRTLAGKLHRPAFVPAPAFALRIAFGLMADEALLTSERVVPKRLSGAGFRFAHPSLDSALAAALHPGA